MIFIYSAVIGSSSADSGNNNRTPSAWSDGYGGCFQFRDLCSHHHVPGRHWHCATGKLLVIVVVQDSLLSYCSNWDFSRMPNVNAPYHYCNKLAWSNVLLLVSRNYWWWLKWLDRMRIRLKSLSIPCYRYRKIVLHTCIKVLHDYATTCRSILLTYIYITLCSICWVIE